MFNEKKNKIDPVKEEAAAVGVDLSNITDTSSKTKIKSTEFADVISSKLLNFREKPDGKIITTLKKGTKLELKRPESKDGKWRNVSYNGIDGWVVSEYLGPTYVEVKTDDQHLNND